MLELSAMAGGGGSRPPFTTQLHPGDDPHMEARLKRVEDDVRAIRIDLTSIITRIGALEGRIGALEAKVDLLVRGVLAKVPTPWQMLGVILSSLLGFMTLLGFAIAALRWLRLLPA